MLLEELITLSRTPYFSKSLEDYLDKLIEAVRHVIAEYDNLPKQVSKDIANIIWIATKYLNGGTSKTIPYETVYALKLALGDWVTEPCAITTALRDDLDYHICLVDPGQILSKFLPQISFNAKLIQIALPKLYRHYPLYNVALYHELGHFVDKTCSIINYSLVLHKPKKMDEMSVRIEANYRQEFFADLFAASYTGNSIAMSLDAIAHDNPPAPSHPGTIQRIEVISDFIAGRPNQIVDFFQDILARLNLPALEKRYITPAINDSFDSIRTYPIADTKELHGIMNAGWSFLDDAYKQGRSPWNELGKLQISRIINDLIEKSIRNRMVKLKWANAINNG